MFLIFLKFRWVPDSSAITIKRTNVERINTENNDNNNTNNNQSNQTNLSEIIPFLNSNVLSKSHFNYQYVGEMI